MVIGSFFYLFKKNYTRCSAYMVSSSDSIHTDVVIIGAGPVGLFAIFECGMLKMKCHVIDALDMVGGQCTALYPEKPIYDIPAHPTIIGADLIKNLEEQAKAFEPVYHLGQQVTTIAPYSYGEKGEVLTWLIETSKGTSFIAKAIIIAAGVGAFGPNRPPLENLEAYEGKSIFYMVRRREDFRGKRIVIAGGGDSALDWALSLAEIAEKIYMVHRRPKFRGAPESVARLEALAFQGLIDLVVPYQPYSLEGDVKTGQLTAVSVQDLDGNIKPLPADVFLPFFGLSMNLGPIASWGLGLDKNHISITQATSETNLSGIYAIGDIATYSGKLKLILTGFAEAAQAAYAIYSRIHPGEVLHFEYSTTKGVPGSK